MIRVCKTLLNHTRILVGVIVARVNQLGVLGNLEIQVGVLVAYVNQVRLPRARKVLRVRLVALKSSLY